MDNGYGNNPERARNNFIVSISFFIPFLHSLRNTDEHAPQYHEPCGGGTLLGGSAVCETRKDQPFRERSMGFEFRM